MVGAVLNRFRRIARQGRLAAERARLLASGQGRLARALQPRACPIGEGIERIREEMQRDSSPLVDGSLGPPGVYDEGQSIADVCRVSKPKRSAELLYSLASEFHPATTLELGTNVGISSAYLAAAGGRVTTLEASPYRLRLAKGNHERLGLQLDYVQGLFSDTLDETLERLPPVDLAFVDGHHQYEPTLRYFEQIAAKAAPGCIFVFDDIRWSDGMRRAWRELKAKPVFEAVADLGDMGVAVLSRRSRQ